MRAFRPARCPTCGQPWPHDDPHSRLRLVNYYIPRVGLMVGVVAVMVTVALTILR